LRTFFLEKIFVQYLHGITVEFDATTILGLFFDRQSKSAYISVLTIQLCLLRFCFQVQLKEATVRFGLGGQRSVCTSVGKATTVPACHSPSAAGR
jgi:hypothetical protein